MNDDNLMITDYTRGKDPLVGQIGRLGIYIIRSRGCLLSYGRKLISPPGLERRHHTHYHWYYRRRSLLLNYLIRLKTNRIDCAIWHIIAKNERSAQLDILPLYKEDLY